MKKIAIIGSGGREHALAWKFAQTMQWENVYTLPGNGGIPNSHTVAVSDFEAIKTFCNANAIDLIFVGPEQPLSEGIVDYFENSSIQVLGADKHSATLEASKIFAKKFMQQHGIATAGFQIFTSVEAARSVVIEKKGDLVIKFDGLAAGKGVFVCANVQEANEALDTLAEKYGNEVDFIIEEKIDGNELSIIAFTDTKSIKSLQISQDHKQLLEGDKGANTGGMGTFSPIHIDKDLHQKIQDDIIQPTLKGIQAEKMNYKGIIFFGIMVKNGNPYLLEYNVRFGDPETEVLLPALKTDLLSITTACLEEKLDSIDFSFEDDVFVDVVLASGGYPKKYNTGYPIKGLHTVDDDVIVFHSGTKKDGDAILTNGGRVLNVVGRGKTLDVAIKKAYDAVAKISFEEMYYRKDIGKRTNTEFKKK